MWEFGHLDDGLLRRGAGPANRVHIDRLVAAYLRRGVPRMACSLLLGAHPDETWASRTRVVAALREIDAAFSQGLAVSYATGGRVYAQAPLGRWVAENRAAATASLYGEWSEGFVKPLVFARPAPPRELFAWLTRELAGCRGKMLPLNAEFSPTPAEVAALAAADRETALRGRWGPAGS